jgi:hypothetical protein
MRVFLVLAAVQSLTSVASAQSGTPCEGLSLDDAGLALCARLSPETHQLRIDRVRRAGDEAELQLGGRSTDDAPGVGLLAGGAVLGLATGLAALGLAMASSFCISDCPDDDVAHATFGIVGGVLGLGLAIAGIALLAQAGGARSIADRRQRARRLLDRLLQVDVVASSDAAVLSLGGSF